MRPSLSVCLGLFCQRPWIDQRHGRHVPDKDRKLRRIAVSQRENVVLALDNDRFPPTIVGRFVCEDHVAHIDFIPALGQPGSYRRDTSNWIACCGSVRGFRVFEPVRLARVAWLAQYREQFVVQHLLDARDEGFPARVESSRGKFFRSSCECR